MENLHEVSAQRAGVDQLHTVETELEAAEILAGLGVEVGLSKGTKTGMHIARMIENNELDTRRGAKVLHQRGPVFEAKIGHATVGQDREYVEMPALRGHLAAKYRCE